MVRHIILLKMINTGKNVDQGRIIITTELEPHALVLLHGFSKIKNVNSYYGIGNANQVTDQLAQIAQMVFEDINLVAEKMDYKIEYLGKAGAEHEVQFLTKY